MKKRYINFVLLVAITAAATFAAIRWLPSLRPTKTEPASGYVSSIEQSSIVRVHFSDRDQEIDFFAVGTPTSTGRLEYTVMDGEPFSYSHDKLYSTIAKLCSIKYLRLIGSYPDGVPGKEKKLYGLEDPAAIITMESNNRNYEFVFGNQSGLNDGRYLLYDNSIYVVAPSVYQLCMKPVNYFRRLEVFPDTGEALEKLRRFAFYGPEDDVVYDICQTGMRGNEIAFSMTEPCEATVMNNAFYTNVVSPVYSFIVMEYVEDFPKDLSQYGLDTPYKILVETTDGESATLLFAPSAEDGVCYGMREDIPAVFSFYGETDFVSIRYYELLDRQMLSLRASDVDTIAVTMPKETVKIACGDNPTVNGKAIMSAEMDTLLQTLTNMRYTGDLLETNGAQPNISITIALADGTKSTYDFYLADAREYAVRLNGKTTFRTNASYINQIQDALEKLL